MAVQSMNGFGKQKDSDKVFVLALAFDNGSTETLRSFSVSSLVHMLLTPKRQRARVVAAL